MDEARLSEIEALFARLESIDTDPDQEFDYGEWEALDLTARQAQRDLIAEVRRLQALQDRSIATINSLTDALDRMIDTR